MIHSTSKFRGKMYELLYIFYYKLIFGRSLPLAGRIGNVIRTWEVKRKKGDIPLSREAWSSWYLSGFWDLMKQTDDLARYSIITGYLQFFKYGGSILDVGCGEGILQARLGPNSYSKYVGIDISDVAIDRASQRTDDKTIFIRDKAANYIPSESFDAIIFNESLYYLDDPVGTMGKYAHYLKEDGLFITSMYTVSIRAASILKSLKKKYISADEVTITNRSNTWVCNVFLAPNGMNLMKHKNG